jgi:ATP-dependent DNA ligase
LRLEGDDLRLRPIEARREALMRLVEGVTAIVFSEAFAAEAAVVFAKASPSDIWSKKQRIMLAALAALRDA